MVRTSIICLLLVAIMLPSQSHAFDKDRKGFVLGLGAGYGSAKTGSVSNGGIATTFKIGGGLSDNVMIYYSNRVVFFSVNSVSFYQGASSVAVSYFLNPTGPSFYFSGELGLGVLASSLAGFDSQTGFAFTLGAGFEFAPTWTIEANYMNVSLDGSDGNSNITAAVTWFAY